MLPLTLLSLVCLFFSESIALPTLQTRIATSSWRKTDVLQSPAEIINITSAALEKAIDEAGLLKQFNGQMYEIFGTMFSEMAQFDAINNQTKYEDSLQQRFSQTQQTRANFGDT
ncbi:hypothetical protein B0H19DRAFT_1029359, partial [Mycena capillaripes]